MQDYHGIDGNFTISTTPGAGAPGVIVNSGAFGVYPKEIECFAGDVRDNNNLNAGRQPNKDAIAWLAWRAIDWINGGDYGALFRASVALGSALILDRGFSPGTTSPLTVLGPTGSGAYAADFLGGGTLGKAARFTAAASAAYAVEIFGGSSSGTALHASGVGTNAKGALFEGTGTAPGLQSTAGGTAGTPSILCHDGPVHVDTNVTASLDPGANHLWANSIPKAWMGQIATDGAGGVTYGDGLNGASVAVNGGDHTKIDVVFAHAMANANYAVTYGADCGGAEFFLCNTVAGSKATTGFSFFAWAVVAAQKVNFATSTVHLDLAVAGKI